MNHGILASIQEMGFFCLLHVENLENERERERIIPISQRFYKCHCLIRVSMARSRDERKDKRRRQGKRKRKQCCNSFI